jgi:hypothetical protein
MLSNYLIHPSEKYVDLAIEPRFRDQLRGFKGGSVTVLLRIQNMRELEKLSANN